jgi:hypothetical protein
VRRRHKSFSYTLDEFERQTGISFGSALHSLKSCVAACDEVVLGDVSFEQINACRNTFGSELTQLANNPYQGRAEKVKALDALR